jgi:ribosomal protein S2
MELNTDSKVCQDTQYVETAAKQCEMQQDRTLPSELLAIEEMEEVILTIEELTALTGLSSSITKKEKQRIKRERDRLERSLACQKKNRSHCSLLHNSVNVPNI